MDVKISHIPLYVTNQDEALAFYTKLGFRVHTDAPFGDMRWLTLCTEISPDFELILSLATPETKPLVGKQGANEPAFCLATSDCAGFIEQARKNGVEIVQEVKKEMWGTSALIKDLYGNLIYVTQQ
jgi:catechol 2,3-dioxygenase-like lactoylglutathione lyase family enzyme